MKNYTNDNTARRYTANISVLGTTQIHLRSPYIACWWSAAFPGLGHFLLSKYIRGFLLFIWEFVVNLNAHINLAIIYSFQGNIDAAIHVLDTKWLLIYTPVYFFCIWDTYRTTIDMNKVYILAVNEGHRVNTFSMNALEINYLDKRKPWMAIMWSMFVPGLGQLYVHRIFTAFVGISAAIGIFYFSNFLVAITLFFQGEFHQATTVLNPEWTLFLPSIYGFSLYDAYVNTVENNKLFDKEQRRFLKANYQNPYFRILKGKGVD